MSRRAPQVVAIEIKRWTGDFAEDKDAAAELREGQIREALDQGQGVVLDFEGVRVATQSFVHALVSDVLRVHGERILDRITFKGCTTAVKGIVETVVQYSLESIEAEDAENGSAKESGRSALSSRQGKPKLHRPPRRH
jgi:hypothetical protein